jgi:hypothetical protein
LSFYHIGTEEANLFITTIFAVGALLSYTNSKALALPADSNGLASSSPFHDCLNAGKDWGECCWVAGAPTPDLKRSEVLSTPFHHCHAAGESWEQCRLLSHGQFGTRTPGGSLVAERSLATTFEGVVSSLNKTMLVVPNSVTL